MSDPVVQPVEDGETLARFILHKGHIRGFGTQQARVRANVFMPGPRGELSVFRHTGISERELWELGKTEVAALRGFPLLGRGDLAVCEARAASSSLVIERSEPPRNHANITGWPTEKASQKIIALALAEASRFVPCGEQPALSE
ncbi:hypothetical protein HZA57_07535 [Candidatus Poribacteria bacterium]|nr:hypothetical protein [Candidatus Poribacteria bacterium]